MPQVTIECDANGPTIDRSIYGHFAEHLGRCVYEGLWVGPDSPIPNKNGLRSDVVKALRDLQVPVLRWPGGCFADEYHWKDGIGPRSGRKRMVNASWGGLVEDNSFGTHEFMELCDQIGCEPYINGNVGSGTVQEMSEWVEYLTFDGDSPMARLRAENGRPAPWKVRYFGVGNESWGCGGNMRPEMYADVYRRYQTFVRNYGENRIHRIACGANGDDYRWTEILMRNAASFFDALTLHHYAYEPDWLGKDFATGFSRDSWIRLLANGAKMDTLITRHRAVMDQFDPEQRVGLIVDEWGAWYKVEPGTNPAFLYQQNTIRDAVLAGMTLNIFHKHSSRVRMANLAQTVNVLQSVILTDGPRMLLTPTYHVLKMYAGHQGAVSLPVDVRCGTLEATGAPLVPVISSSASRDERGTVRVSFSHLDPDRSAEVTLRMNHRPSGRPPQGLVLTAPGMDSHNTFEAPETVRTASFKDWVQKDGDFLVTLPPRSVVTLEFPAP